MKTMIISCTHRVGRFVHNGDAAGGLLIERDEMMIKISLKQLASAIAEADAFKLPDMNEGTSYLYDTVYRRMSRGEPVRLSELDFDAFETEDVDSLNDLYSDVFERNGYAAHSLACTLRSMAPASKAVAYV